MKLSSSIFNSCNIHSQPYTIALYSRFCSQSQLSQIYLKYRCEHLYPSVSCIWDNINNYYVLIIHCKDPNPSGSRNIPCLGWNPASLSIDSHSHTVRVRHLCHGGVMFTCRPSKQLVFAVTKTIVRFKLFIPVICCAVVLG